MLDTANTPLNVRYEVGALKEALTYLMKSIEKRVAIDVLHKVLFMGDGRIRSTDLDQYSTFTIDGNFDHPRFLIDAADLKKLIDTAPKGGLVRFEGVPGDASLTYDDGEMVAALEARDPLDFPLPSPRGPIVQSFSMDVQELRRHLEIVAPCISTEQTRYYLNGVFMHPHSSHALAFVATNGQRLAFSSSIYFWECDDFQKQGKIVPIQAVKTLLSSIGKKMEGECTIHIHDLRVVFSLPDGLKLETKVIDGTYPDYPRVIPDTVHAFTRIKTETASKGLARLEKLGGKNTFINLDPEEDAMTRRDGNFYSVKLGVSDGEGDPLEQGFNVTYLKECLKTLGGSSMMLGQGKHVGDPVKVWSGTDQSAFWVIMPKRVA